MLRLTLLLLAAATLSAAQPNARPLLPITGRVVDAVTGEPIAGATINYGGGGISFASDSDFAGKHPFDPPSLQGDVTSRADGSFTTPGLPAFGRFFIRVTAPGYFAVLRSLQALPDSAKSGTIPPPPGYQGPPLPPRPFYDSVFRLQSGIEPIPMSTEGLPPGSLGIFTDARPAHLSPDGDSLLFTLGHSLWLYQIPTQKFQEIKLLPQVDSAQIAFDGKTILFYGEIAGQPLFGSAVLPSLEFQTIPAPNSLEANIIIKRWSAGRFQPEQIDIDCEPPPGPGRYTGCQTQVAKLVVHDLSAHRDIPILQDATERLSHVLDEATSTLFYLAPESGSSDPHALDHIAALNLLSGKKTFYAVPGHISVGEIQILDVKPLRQQDSRTTVGFRLAYERPGDCDPNAGPLPIDASQPRSSPDYSSICFLTLPYTPPPLPPKRPATPPVRPAPKSPAKP